MMCAENGNRSPRKYPLLPYSQLVWDMMQVNEHVYTFRSRARVKNEAGLAQKIADAFRKAIQNHAAFSMRVDENGQQYYEPLNDPLHGQFHNIDIEEKGDYIEISIGGNRITGDGISGQIVFEDLIRAYNGLPLEQTDYLEYLELVEQYKQTDRYKANKQWLEAKFDNMTAPVRPTTDFPLNVSDIWEEGVSYDDWSKWQEDIVRLQQEQMVTLTGIVSLAAALAIMDYNNTNEAALTWAYDGRETPLEQRIVGSLHRDIPLMIRREGTEDMLRQVRTEIRQGIAHSGYPYTLTAPHTEVWNYAVNVLQQPTVEDILQQMPFEVVEVENEDSNCENENGDENKHIAYSLLDIEIYAADTLTIVYRYSATHYKAESIQRFAELVRKNLLKLLHSEARTLR